MCNSSSKSSFSIDDILCHSSPRSNVSVPMANPFTDLPAIALNNNVKGQTQYFPNLFDLIPPRYCFPHPQPTHPTYIDPYASVFEKGLSSNLEIIFFKNLRN